MMVNQGASGVASGKSSLLSSCEWEHGIALESWQGNRASRCIEGGISRSFWSKLWFFQESCIDMTVDYKEGYLLKN